jgi:hypothetical protein
MGEKQDNKSLTEIIGDIDQDELRRLATPITSLTGQRYYGHPPTGFGRKFSIYAHFLDLKDLIIATVTDPSLDKTGVLATEELEAWRHTFSHFVDTLDANQYRSEQLFLAAVGAIEAAFILGSACGNPEYARTIVGKLKKVQTEPAVQARRALVVQTIIEGEARIYWDRHPDRPVNLRETAHAIWRRVQERLNESDNIPKAWRADDCDKLIERIRGRLRKTLVQDNRRLSKKKSGRPSSVQQC